MNSFPTNRPNRVRGFSLIELMVGLTIGFIAVVIIMQSLSVFESHKRTTTAGVDAQENGLLALMAVEADLRKAAAGINHPALFSCRNFFSYYQAASGTGAPTAVSSFSTIPVLITDGVKADTISIQNGMRITGAAPTQLSSDMRMMPTGVPDHLELDVDRAYDLLGEPDPASSDDPPADLVVVVNPDFGNCSLMRVSSITGNVLSIANGPAGKEHEYNAPIAYMTNNNWPGFGTRAGQNNYQGALVFRVGSVELGGMRNITYSVDANNSLAASVVVTGAAVENSVVASEIVALQAQYGVSNSPADKVIRKWVNPVQDSSGDDWRPVALTANTAASVQNLQRIKAIRVAVVARSSQRDAGVVTAACTNNNATNYGPCSWTDDSATNPAPAIDLRATAADTEWQHYRYRVYQTVIPMRNLLWPDL